MVSPFNEVLACRSCLHVLIPDPVMLFRPHFVHVTGPHSFVSVVHPDRTEINMAKAGCYEQRGSDRVRDVSDLHDRAALPEVGKIHDESRGADNDAEKQHAKPEPELLTRVETSRRHVAAAQHATETSDPFEIDRAPYVVAHEGDKCDDRAEYEERTHKV